MIRFAQLEEAGAACAAMSERADGDCRPPLGRDESCRSAFCDAAGTDARRLVMGAQVHGRHVEAVTGGAAGRGASAWAHPRPQTDGLVTREKGLPLAVLIADCVPVLLYDPRQTCGGVLHAGRRGTEANIATAGVEALTAHYGSSPDDAVAAIGPSAGPCCYEVSEELADVWRMLDLPARGRYLDLWRANAQQLAEAGVREENIHITGVCTICSGRFFSHRMDAGARRRNMAVLTL